MLYQVDEVEPWPDSVHFSLMYLGIIEAYLNERSSYESHRRRMLTRFASATAPSIAERVAKTSLLLPLAGDELQTALDLAERAFRKTEDPIQYFAFTGALAKYQAGEWPAAAERAERALELASDGPSFLLAMDHLVLALVRSKMGQPTEARTALTKADEIIQRDFPSGIQLGSSSWHDMLVAHGRSKPHAATALDFLPPSRISPRTGLGGYSGKPSRQR